MQENSEHIIALLQRKDEKAIDLIYDAYGENLYGYLFQMLGSENEAQDVMQDSFVKIWRYAERYDPQKSRLFTWLLSICRNTAIDLIRKKKNINHSEIQEQLNHVYNTTTETQPDTMDIRKHLDALDAKYREVVYLLFFQGYTQKEASDHLGIPLGTVKTRLKIAIRELNKVYSFNKNNLSLLILLLWMTG